MLIFSKFIVIMTSKLNKANGTNLHPPESVKT